MVWITLPGIYVDKFCHIVADPFCAHHGPHFGKFWFKLHGVLIKLLNLRWPLNVMIIFLYFCLQSNKIRISSSLFRIGKNMKSGV